MLSFLPNLFYLLAFFAGTFVSWKLFREENYEEAKVIDLVLFSTLIAILVGRFFYLICAQIFNFHPPAGGSIFNFLGEFFFFTNGGFHFNAAIFAFLLFTLFFLRRNKWPIFPALDFLSLGASVAATIVHFGVFLSSIINQQLTIGKNFGWVIYIFSVAGLLFLIKKKYYQKGRVFALALLATLRPSLVLTGVISFYIIDGKEYVAEFRRGFREGFRKKISNI